MRNIPHLVKSAQGRRKLKHNPPGPWATIPLLAKVPFKRQGDGHPRETKGRDCRPTTATTKAISRRGSRNNNDCCCRYPATTLLLPPPLLLLLLLLLVLLRCDAKHPSGTLSSPRRLLPLSAFDSNVSCTRWLLLLLLLLLLVHEGKPRKGRSYHTPPRHQAITSCHHTSTPSRHHRQEHPLSHGNTTISVPDNHNSSSLKDLSPPAVRSHISSPPPVNTSRIANIFPHKISKPYSPREKRGRTDACYE